MILCWILFCAIHLVTSVEVNLTGDWRAGVGWELVCSWRLLARDRLQSVRLYRDDVQFNIFRPESDSRKINKEFRLPDSYMHLDCMEREPQRGSCILSIEITEQYNDMVVYSCEVSGERPTFLIRRKDLLVEPYVPSNDATVEASARLSPAPGSVELNCTATGLPAPELVWTVAHQKMKGQHNRSQWNATTKLYHSWSSVALTPRPGEALPVLCVPSQTTKRGVALGPPAEFILEEMKNAAIMFRDHYMIHLLAAIILVR